MYSIIICDDEKIERDYIKRILTKYPNDYQLIGEAANGKEVIELSFKYNPDIIIMDIKMPIYSGLEAARIIKLQFKNVIIILNSAYSEFEFAQRALNYGLDGYLLKPSSEKIIIETIKSSLEKKETINLIHENSSFFSSVITYPHDNIKSLIDSIYLKDIYLIKSNIEPYLAFLEKEKENLCKYKINIINTMFSLMIEMQNFVSEEAYIRFYNLNHILKINRKNYSYELLNIIEDFLISFIYTLENEFQSNSSCEDIVQNYIDNHFKEEITLESLSEIFHFNPSYISRSFHQNKKVTISSYINKKRIDYSIDLLKNSNLLIKEIAWESGFINTSHFNKVFKDVTGKTPSSIERRSNN